MPEETQYQIELKRKQESKLKDSLLIWLALAGIHPKLGGSLEQQIAKLRQIINNSSLNVVPLGGKISYIRLGIGDEETFIGYPHGRRVEVRIRVSEEEARGYKVEVHEYSQERGSEYRVRHLADIIPVLHKM